MAERLEGRKSNVSNELIASFAIECEQAQREIDEASGKKRAVLKRAKASGLNTKALLAAISIKKQDDDTTKTEERDRLRYAAIIVPGGPWKQEELFADLDLRPLNRKAQAAQTDWEMEMTGYQAGRDGHDKSANPHHAGTPGFVKWQAGWQRGQLHLANTSDPESNSKVADIGKAKRRSGRDKAAEPEEQTDLEDAVAAQQSTSGLLTEDTPPAGAA